MEAKTGFLTLTDGRKDRENVRIQLTRETLVVQKEETYFVNPVDCSVPNGPELDTARERTVVIRRQRVGGLGLSIKGGAEHNIPVLVSRIFKDQAADQSGDIYVGDAVLKVNGMSIERATHDEAVAALKNAGAEVSLTVRHFRAATPYLKQAAKLADEASEREKGTNNNSNDEDGWQTRNSTPIHQPAQAKTETRWMDAISIPLLMARVTRYVSGTDKIRTNSFEVIGMDGVTSGILLARNSVEFNDWLKCVSANVATLNAQSMKLSNDLLPPSEQVVHMGWVAERVPTNPYQQAWIPKFLAIKGSDVMLFDAPPLNTRDWVKCERVYKLYEVITRIFKDSELLDDRPHCFSLQSGADENHYMSTESRSELNVWQSAVLRATHAAAIKLASKTYGCTWRKRVVGLTLDLTTGFTLFDAQNKSVIWRYRFSQLKGSSDDSQAKVRLQFLNSSGQIELQEMECPNLKRLLHCMHAFLAAKLASVDPSFMRSASLLPGDLG
ncbi:gamma-2-syntrophin-like isoform X2 [Amphiura filiformis]|uniref:gamma-2-syntrophin-like isoform X2 n=1 Tax=Amphiura filiformis TaxID=82378 RepID=UPI003B2171E9